MITTAASIALGVLMLAGVLCLIRLIKGPSLANRIVALDALLLMVVTGLAVQAAITGEDTYLDAMVVAALLGFTGTGLIAKFIERRRG
ncbi:MAG: monovalent cation/H+ antiporter complex subunit F [Actinomycetota bacterium]